MDIEKIIDNLNQHKEKIIERLLLNNGGHFVRYFLIREKFLKDNIDDGFQRDFCYFYVMNGARGLNGPQKEVLFKLLLLKENSLSNILKNLYEIPGYGDKHKLFLSFGTKLLHTIDKNLPIYDGNIAHILELPKQASLSSLEEKIQNRISIYNELKECFKILLGNIEIKNYLKDIRQDFCSRTKQVGFDWKDNLISDTKLLDSLLWVLHTILRNKSL